MRIQIIARDNKYGLSKDREVLASVLQGHAITFASPSRQEKGKFDINFHLEHIVPRNFASAPLNIAIPNPEWCSRGMRMALRGCDAVIAKTRDGERELSKLDLPVHYIGWTSPDHMMDLPRTKSIVHIAGNSPLKSTHAVVEAFRSLPSLKCTVYWRRQLAGKPANVDHVSAYLSDEQMRAVINQNLIHVLPSQMEGFGHILNEAMSVGATVVTTNAPPMNTLGTYHVKTTGSHPQNLAQIWHLDPTDLKRKILQAWEETSGMNHGAREAYLMGDRLFRVRFAEVFETVLQRKAA